MTGDSGANALSGSGGADLLTGGAGADTLDGGAGVDTASYAGSLTGVTVDLGLSVAQVGAGDAAGDRLISIESLVGSGFADTLIGDANANSLSGGLGADSITGGGGADTISGGGGDDRIAIGLSAFAGGANVDGGDGVDTLTVSGVGAAFNLSSLSSSVTAIETLDLRNGGNGTIALTAADIIAMTDPATRDLTIRIDSGDVLQIGGFFTSTTSPDGLTTDITFYSDAQQSQVIAHLTALGG
ncbi:MAG: calcium-binding protein [Alphaproteobacteria bacterium]|nr:calcium-binding protein [Alphaproteobacteria bacterium]